MGMATRKVTLSLDAVALRLAEQAAAREGVSTSMWISRAARREAVRTGAGTSPDVIEEAVADEADLTAAEEHMRAAG